ncbi:hemolysin secretion protein D [Labrys miyagiensis]|uniref:Hemolysin secretion protein D n=1 Tax=Labrys miyagiensis TaxID=346912 RepID=A0ABQ6CMG4_9HYPH|nr:HlyD family secretion protein [Labrys miyagiensis]GLS21320.1 hemolysin secretion protein D [Labrys miyagiensis]
MTKHSPSLEIDRPIPAAEAAPGLDITAKPAVPPVVAPPAPTKKSRLRKPLLIGASLLILAGAAYYGEQYWTVGRFQVSTDDAYVQADNTTIAPKISGYLSDVLVGDNETVKAGQVLARIDDRDFKVALDQAKADVLAAQAAIAGKQAALDTQQSIIDAAKATITVDQANETFAEQDDKRYASLANQGFGSVQNAQQASARILAARATIQRDTAALVTATKQVDSLKAELAQAQATLAHDQAVQHQAELNLSYTNVVSPVAGVVGNRTLRVGQYVQAGTQLMAVVPTQAAYIVANYKETQLTDVHAGQPVDIDVDMFPGASFKGHVDSLAPASGQEFALLPPDNATGNFTKVVQRIPVKIVLDAGSPLASELRPGMSVYPTIETK